MFRESRGLHVVLSSLRLEALSWNIPNHDVSLVICLDLQSLWRQSQYSGLDRIDVVTPRNTLPPDDLVPWLQSGMLRCSFQHTCHPPSTRHTRPPQDHTPAVYFPGKFHNGGHV